MRGKYIYSKYDAMDIAEYVLWYHEIKLNQPINNLRLNKLLYYIQGAYLVEYNKVLYDNDIECWEYGAVIPDVYYYYNGFSCNDITGVIPNKEFLNKISKEELDIIETICEITKSISIWDLVKDIQNHNCYKKNFIKGYKKIILSEDIKEDFIKKINEDRKVMMFAKYNALDIANYILWYYEVKLKDEIDNLKLNKILYYLQGVYIAKYDYPLFKESMKCSKYGTIVFEVYNHYCLYGSCLIGNNKEPIHFINKISSNELDVINSVCNSLKDIPVYKLIEYIKQDDCYKEAYQENNQNELCLIKLKRDFLKKIK